MTKREMKRIKARNTRIALIVCLMLVVCIAAVGGTIAWLTDSTETITNTFTSSDVDITLTETLPANKTAKMVPGTTIAKNPEVKVLANSETCWLFIKVDKSSSFDTYMTYNMAAGWEQLKDTDNNDVVGVFYREVAANTADQPFAVLADNKVTVKSEITKTQMDALEETDAVQPTMAFTAYAIQKQSGDESSFTALDAWTKVKPTNP